ncbi:hypothetical protein PVAND_008651 [Polypedilum vanderplanki]|uniref:DNA polymerase epsilon subunit 3 n=1 Tax=Polypedilum vanderplanki TaxID=319348 RepID=A0A9J6CBQ8_POLVA|nr:hypothetical protein PVAND_008651 [Polypedilum vanderplanki]
MSAADEKISDLQLPIASVARLIKEALPNGAIAKQEAKLAIARAASVFVLFLTSATIDVTTSSNQKTLMAQHVFNALKEIEFEMFLPELQKSLETYRQAMKNKKDRKSINDASENNTENQIEDEEDVIQIDDD